MIDTTSKIKNLAIALEALSRINGAKSTFEEVNDLLWVEITDKQQENERTHNVKTQASTLNPDDEIPF